jgi:hypothetical protein
MPLCVQPPIPSKMLAQTAFTHIAAIAFGDVQCRDKCVAGGTVKARCCNVTTGQQRGPSLICENA